MEERRTFLELKSES
ncbi:hypothetical protein LINPERHAP1_LOCUS23100 [Linum perenne]